MKKYNNKNSVEASDETNVPYYVTVDTYTEELRLWFQSCMKDDRDMFHSRYNDVMEAHYRGTKLEAFGNLVFEVYGELQRGVRYSESMLNLDYIDKAQVREYLCWCAAAGVAASRLQEGLRLRKTSDYDVKPNRLWRNPNSYVQADHDNKYGDKSLICYKYFYNVEKRSGTRALDIIPILNEFVRDNRLHILDIYRNLFLR